MTEAPPVLMQRPQFTADYWRKIPRQVARAQIARVTNTDDGWVEIVLKGGMGFRRRKDEIQQLLTANLDIEIEAIVTQEGELITGLMVPKVGWAFRMTAEDLAEYTKQLSMAMHERRVAQTKAMVAHVAEQLKVTITDLEIPCESDEQRTEWATQLAAAAIYALETGRTQ